MTQAHRSPAIQLGFVAGALPRAVPIAIPARPAKPGRIAEKAHRTMAAMRAWLLAPAQRSRSERAYRGPEHLDFIEDAAMGREMLRL